MDNKQLKSKIEKIRKDTGSVVVALQFAQTTFGCVTPDAVAVIADVFEVSRCAVYSTATFYHQFSFVPKGKNVIAVCMGTACFVCGAEGILKKIEDDFGIKAGQVTADGMFSIEHNTRCVGICDAAPVVMVNDQFIRKAKINEVSDEIRRLAKN